MLRAKAFEQRGSGAFLYDRKLRPIKCVREETGRWVRAGARIAKAHSFSYGGDIALWMTSTEKNIKAFAG